MVPAKSLLSKILSRYRQYWWNLFINGILMSYVIPLFVRRFILNCLGAKIKGIIHGHCTILTKKIQIGRGSFINRNCFIDNNAQVIIGENCSIGYNVTIITTNHTFGDINHRAGNIIPKSIEIKDGCWIGANTIILPGIVIEKGCVIAAGSIVYGVCNSNFLYAGAPAHIKRELK